MSQNISFEILNPQGGNKVLVLCDHASNFVPECVGDGDLGISPQDMNRHIAYDIGARAVARLMAVKLDAKMLATRFSRLVIDPNRGEDDPTILMKIYDRTVIPGNRNADGAERERRIAKFHRPYHNAITAQLHQMGKAPVLISVHSFTPQLRGRPKRPWHIGVLWDSDPRIACPLIEKLDANPDICIGDNEPYSGELRGDTMYHHATRRGFPHVLIELRHDLIETPEGQERWAGVLAEPLAEIIATL